MWYLFGGKRGSRRRLVREPAALEQNEMAQRPVTRDELHREGMKLRDNIAFVCDDLMRLGARVAQLERQMREWREHLG